MKKNFNYYFVSVLILLGIGFNQTVLAESTYYAQGVAKVSSGSPQGAGKVYVNYVNQNTPAPKAPSDKEWKDNKADKTSTDAKSTTYDFYFYAKANTGYEFLGWSKTDGGTDLGKGSDENGTLIQQITSPSSDGTTTETRYAHFAKVAQAVDVTYLAPTNGSYTFQYNDEENPTLMESSSNPVTINKAQKVTLSATPATGYIFAGWYSFDATSGVESYFSTDAIIEDYPFSESQSVCARFITATTPIFIVKRLGDDRFFFNLTDAINATVSNDVIVLTKNGTIDSGDYTIPQGVTLLIPNNDKYEVSGKNANISTDNYISQSPFITLTIDENAHIIVQGDLEIGGTLCNAYAQGSKATFPGNCCLTGTYGRLVMKENSSIILENGSNLFAWGLVVSDINITDATQGSITAKSGSTVYEPFQLTDFSGGSALDNWYNRQAGTKNFMYTQYYVQNVEVPMTFEYDALEKVQMAIYPSISGSTQIDFIGSNNQSLFQLNEGTTVKKWYYHPTDRQKYEVNGNCQINDLVINVAGYSMSTSSYRLPLTNNMTVSILSGTTTINADAVMLADVQITIGNDAKAIIPEGKSLWLYDKDQWGKTYDYVTNYIAPLQYAWPNNTYRTYDKMDDAKLEVNGILEVNGNFFTTESGAQVISTNESAQIQLTKPLVASPSEYTLHPMTQNGSKGGTNTYADIIVTPAKLKNIDDTYTASIGTTTFTNVHGRWFGGDAKNEKEDHTYNFTYIDGEVDVTTDAIYWLDAQGEGHWSNATTENVTYANTWIGTNEEDGINAYYSYLQNGWVKLTQVGETDNFAGSDNNMYMYISNQWQSIGTTDDDCLYTVNAVKVALVGNQLIHIEPNTNPEDGAWNDGNGNYFADLSNGACLWSVATKIDGVEKAYIINEQHYIRLDQGAGEDWVAVGHRAPYYYTENDQNIRTYYEYNAGIGVWQEVAPTISVTSDGATNYFYFLSDAITAAKGMFNPTITLLADVSNAISHTISSTAKSTQTIIDLNGHTINSSVSQTLKIDASNMTVTITDNSVEKKGQILVQQDANARCYAVYVTAGTLVIDEGTIKVTNAYTYNSSTAKATQASAIYVAAKATCYINGGTIESVATYNPYGLHIAGSATSGSQGKAYINGGEIKVTSTQASEPVGVYSLGETEMSEGTIIVTSKTSNPRGAQAAGSASKYAGTFRMTGGTINVYSTTTGATGVYATVANKEGISYPGEVFIEGGNIIATSGTTTAYGVYASYAATGADNKTAVTPYYYYTLIGRAHATISGGTIIAQTAAVNGSTPTTTCYGVYSVGETTITGGTIKALPATTTGYGVWCGDGTMTISGNPTITAKATTKAYGAWVSSFSFSSKTGLAGCGVLNISGGTFNAETTTGAKAYGLYVERSSVKITKTDSGYYPNETPYVGFGTANISGGTFNAIAKTTTAYGAYTNTAVTGIITANSTADAIAESSLAAPTLNITGGEFSATAGTTTAYGVYNLGNTTINGGTYTAHAVTKTVNAVYVGATQTANAEVAYPTCVINAGKFSATQTDSKTVVANINNASKEPNKFVLNGGYYTKNSYLDTYKASDKTVRTLPDDHVEKANGYNYSIEKVVDDITAGDEAAKQVNIDAQTTATNMTIHTDGTVNIQDFATVEVTSDFIIEANTNTSGELIGAEKVTVSTNVYFDYTFNTPKMRWNAIAFPWQVDATSGVQVGATTLTLGRDFDIIYYDGYIRATRGPVDDCWKYVEDDGDKTLVPGRLYMILFAQPQTVVRFVKKADAPLVNTEVGVAEYSGSSQDANWNGIANPTLYHAFLQAGVDEGQVYNNADDSYSIVELKDTEFPVGKPVFVQAAKEQSVVVSKEQPANAPMRAASSTTNLRAEVEIIANNVATDKVIVRTNEDALNEYTIGSDLAKAGVSSKVAQLWVNRYGTQLCKNTIAPLYDVAEYPLTIFAPTTGAYTLAIRSINSDCALYLTQNGEAIADLTQANHTLNLTKGNHSEYGLRLVDKQQPGVVTSLDEALMLRNVHKVIYREKLYIIRNKHIYNAAGQFIK